MTHVVPPLTQGEYDKVQNIHAIEYTLEYMQSYNLIAAANSSCLRLPTASPVGVKFLGEPGLRPKR